MSRGLGDVYKRQVTGGTLDRRSRAAFRIPAHLERVRAVVRGTKGWADAASPGLSLTGGSPSGAPGGGGHARGHIGG